MIPTINNIAGKNLTTIIVIRKYFAVRYYLIYFRKICLELILLYAFSINFWENASMAPTVKHRCFSRLSLLVQNANKNYMVTSTPAVKKCDIVSKIFFSFVFRSSNTRPSTTVTPSTSLSLFYVSLVRKHRTAITRGSLCICI